MEACLSKFRTEFGNTIFNNKYAKFKGETWEQRAWDIVEDVTGSRWGKASPLLSKEDQQQLFEYIRDFKFLPGGRYIWYAGRGWSYFNNCFLLRAEHDTREEWADLLHRGSSCLLTGGGIGIDYSILRPRGSSLSKTGGSASGPVPLMQMMNEVGRGIMQGGSRRSAIYASLNWKHADINEFLTAKNWSEDVRAAKEKDFNAHAPLDMTNISVNYDDAAFREVHLDQGKTDLSLLGNPVFLKNCRQAMETGEPGFSFNFGAKQNETLRNACTEVTSEDDSDVCNLGSINLGNIQSIGELKAVVQLSAKFLVCGTLRADLPYDKVYKVREKNRRLGLGLMGIHEWLLKRGHGYEVTPELHEWLKVYRDESKRSADEHCDRFFISRPIAYRAIAPTGSIGILAGKPKVTACSVQ